MEFTELFKHARALNQEPVFRNINTPRGRDAFEDLLDSQDDPEDADLALETAGQMRSCLEAPQAAPHYEHAINNVFSRSLSYPTRYGDGSFPVWYGCLEPLTTIYETAYHMIRETLEFKAHHSLIETPLIRRRTIYQVACTAILIDLTRQKRFFPQLTDPIDYTITQQIGRRVRWEHHPGILVPSARKEGGVNLAAFTPQVLSSPIVYNRLTYQLDLQAMRLNVVGENGGQNRMEELFIEASHWSNDPREA